MKRGCMAAGLLAFFIALFASMMLVVPVRAFALRVGMVDLPGPRKVHQAPIPLLGGLAMYAAVVIAVLLAFQGQTRTQIAGILIGATLVAAVGILDDRGLLHHQVKLFVGMPVAAGILLLTGIRAQIFGVLLGGRGGEILDSVLTVLWVVGITASFSILDHMDGLCAGVAAMASVFFALLAYLNRQTLVTVLAGAVLGAATGFLRWNFKPAKIFMGDGGAMFLGFLMATLGLKLRIENAAHLSSWVAPVLILGAAIFDTTWSPFLERGAGCSPLPRLARTTRPIVYPISVSAIAEPSSPCIFLALWEVARLCSLATSRRGAPWFLVPWSSASSCWALYISNARPMSARTARRLLLLNRLESFTRKGLRLCLTRVFLCPYRAFLYTDKAPPT